MASAENYAIIMEKVIKTYGSGTTAVRALKGVDLAVSPGEVVGLVGPSGSGKSTLLQCLGAVIDPSAGKITLGGDVVYENGWHTKDLRALRRDKIGFIFQAPYLIPFLSVLDNVALMPMLAGQSNTKARERAMELLVALEVDHRAQAKPSQLSGGEQQRVSIARALANRPPVILADEPTAALDSHSGREVVDQLRKLAREQGTTVLVVTHDPRIEDIADRIVHLEDGRIQTSDAISDAAHR